MKKGFLCAWREHNKFLCVGLFGIAMLLSVSVSCQAARYAVDKGDDFVGVEGLDPWMNMPMLDLTQSFDKQGYRYLQEAGKFIKRNNSSAAEHALNKAWRSFLMSFQEKANVFAANGLAKIALLRQDYKEADKWLQRSFELDANMSETLFLQAKSLMGQKKYKKAKAVLQDLVKKNDTYKFAFIALAEIAVKNKQFPAAEKYLERVLVLDSSMPIIYSNLAKLYDFDQRRDKALKILLQGYEALRNDESNGVMLAADLAQYYVKINKPEQGLMLAKNVFKRFPDSPLALNIYLDTLVINRKQDQAEALLRDKIKRNANNINFKRKLVFLLMKDKTRKADVIALFNDILADKNKNALDYLAYFRFLIKEKHYDDAGRVISDVRKLFPDSNIADLLEAEWFLAKKKLTQAVDAYSTAYKKSPNNNLLVKLVQALSLSGQKDRAIALVKDEINIKHSIAARVLLAGLYLSNNHVKEAEAEYRSVLTENPNHFIALNDLAWLLGQSGRVKEALPLAKKAYAIAPMNPEVVDTYVNLLRKVGMNEKAEKVATGQLD